MAKESVAELTNGEFASFLEKNKFAVIDFFAEWCMPCVMMTPIFESVAEANKDKVKFAKVNIEDAAELSQKYEVNSIPCIIFFKDGKEVDRIIGSVQEEELESKVKKLS